MTADLTQFVRENSPFFDRLLNRHPDWFERLQTEGRLLGDLPPTETQLSDDISISGLNAGLRRFRNREMMRIIWRDLSRTASLEQTLSDTSTMAELCVQRALAEHTAELTQRFGTPRCSHGSRQQLIVLGLGKLGGAELNLSSDIDLILCYPKQGECDGHRALANQQFFTRLARAMIRSLSEITEDGFCFRVDTRLRPYGDSGPLVMSFSGMEHYYQTEGRDWERYALIKARTVAGDPSVGEQLLQMLGPFVYRRYIDYGAVEALHEMLASIREDSLRENRLEDIKRGRGGIREIEFLVQCKQLLRGGREPSLQTQSLFLAMREVGRLKLLPDSTIRSLREDYAFLRCLENAIQALHDQQIHSLPTGKDLQRVTHIMQLSTPRELHEALTRTRSRVMGILDESFPPASAVSTSTPWQKLLLSEPGEWSASMQEFEQRLTSLSLTSRARQRINQFMPMLIERLQRLKPRLAEQVHQGLQDDALELVMSVCRRSAYLALLVQNPDALDRMLDLFHRSEWIARTVIRYPALLDELIDPELGRNIPDRDSLEDSLSRLLQRHHEPELQLETLNHVKAAQCLRLAVAELSEQRTDHDIENALTELAEVEIEACLDMALRLLSERHGRLSKPGLAVIGYGTLGGRDMNYSSDLDLVFLYRQRNGQSDGHKPLEAEPYYTRLTRRFLALCTQLTRAGRLYEIDTRLRPNGKAGLLVSSLSAFERYQKESAWVWEWQALVRARPVAGDAKACSRFEQIRHEVLIRKRDPEQLRLDVQAMRQRMREELSTGDDLKHGPGGLLDIDFVAQLGILECAHQWPELSEKRSTHEQLWALQECGWITDEQAEVLTSTHRQLTRARHLNTLRRGDFETDVERAQCQQVCAAFLN